MLISSKIKDGRSATMVSRLSWLRKQEYTIWEYFLMLDLQLLMISHNKGNNLNNQKNSKKMVIFPKL